MVVLKPNVIQNWVAYLVAAHLTKDFALCSEIWSSLAKIISEDPKQTAKLNEMTEIYLYRARQLEEMGETRKALNFLQKNGNKYIVDEYRLNEEMARMYMKVGLNDKAIACLEHLLRLNSCNKDYYKQILEAKGIEIGKSESDAQIVEILGKYE